MKHACSAGGSSPPPPRPAGRSASASDNSADVRSIPRYSSACIDGLVPRSWPMKLHIVAALALFLSTAATAATNWASVDQALGRPGAVQAGDVHRYSFPRSDLGVTPDGG